MWSWKLTGKFGLIAGGILLAAAGTACADAGSPMIWAVGAHLLLGNALIGVGEGLLISFFFGSRRGRSIGWMILANYVSSWAGLLMIDPAWSVLERALPGPAPIFKVRLILILMTVLTWVVSVLLEWPFCALILKGQGMKTSLRASLLAQTASYLLVLLPFYFHSSHATLITQTSLHAQPSFARKPAATVFYSDDQGAVWKIQTDGTGQVKMLNHARPLERLYFSSNPATGLCDLWKAYLPDHLSHNKLGGDKLATERLISNVGAGCAFMNEEDLRSEGLLSPVQITDFRTERSERSVRVPTNAKEWFMVLRGRKEDFSLGLVTPFQRWSWRSVTVLPGDQVVTELDDAYGAGQIVLLDLNDHKLAVIALGHNPLVLPQTGRDPR